MSNLPITQPLQHVLQQLPQARSGGHTRTTGGELTVFDDDSHTYIAMRASGSEPGARLYIEVSP
ncbi:hypothetical protein ACQEVF_57285 [Nonomuraea polychroma]|uniref:hypothetical protein n=1 Tax=Nonomuraea polychroma TaxID=46176 RepID=UPI003D8BED24